MRAEHRSGRGILRLLPDKRCDCRGGSDRSLGLNQLLVDVSVIYRHDARTGIQRVVRAVLLQLMRFPIPGFEVKPVFATAQRGYCYAPPDFLDRTRSEYASASTEYVQISTGDIFFGLDLAANLLPRHERQIRCWKRHGTSVHIMVYDLLPLLQRQWFHRRTQKHFARWLQVILRNADSTVCISEQVRSDFKEFLVKARSGRFIDVNKIGLGGDIRESAPSKGLPENFAAFASALKGGSVTLMVGTIEPRKGYDRALAAFEEIWKQEPELARRLVIVGKPGWKTDSLQRSLREHPEAGKRLHWIEDASDELVEHLYKLANGVFITSHAEGYGLPLAEACAHRKPILARDLAVFREFQYPDITFFDDDRPSSLAQRICVWLNNSELPRAPSAPLSPADWAATRKALLMAIGINPSSSSSNETTPPLAAQEAERGVHIS
jgi:glycosyltransferase involved in cell wall biosynthesis